MYYDASLLAHVSTRLDSSFLFSIINGTRVGPDEIAGNRAVISHVFFLRLMAESCVGVCFWGPSPVDLLSWLLQGSGGFLQNEEFQISRQGLKGWSFWARWSCSVPVSLGFGRHDDDGKSENWSEKRTWSCVYIYMCVCERGMHMNRDELRTVKAFWLRPPFGSSLFSVKVPQLSLDLCVI